MEDFYQGYLSRKPGFTVPEGPGVHREQWIMESHPVIQMANGIPGKLSDLLNQLMLGEPGQRATLLQLANRLQPLPTSTADAQPAAASGP